MKIKIIAFILAMTMSAAMLSGCYTEVEPDDNSSSKINSTDSANNTSVITVNEDSSDETQSSGEQNPDTSGAASGTISNQPNNNQNQGNNQNNSSKPDDVKPGKNDTAWMSGAYADFNKFYDYGAKHIERAANDYWLVTGVMKEELHANGVGSLWPFSIYAEAVGARMEADPQNAAVKAEYKKVLEAFDRYRHRGRTDGLLAYACYPGNNERFYDDNAWVMLEFIHAYRLGMGPEYLQKAEDISKFIMSGWDEGETFGVKGGLFWNENGKEEKNTCINAPAALGLAELYQITKKSEYLDNSKKLYKWTKDNLMNKPDDGHDEAGNYLYFDKFYKNGLDTMQLSYNVGNMISAGAKLYTITKDKQYLTDARRSAEASYKKFGVEASRADGKHYAFYATGGANAWFNNNLLKGYIYLYEVDKTNTNIKYIDSFRSALANACLITEDTRGYVPDDWKTAKFDNRNLDMRGVGGTARILFMIDKFLKTK